MPNQPIVVDLLSSEEGEVGLTDVRSEAADHPDNEVVEILSSSPPQTPTPQTPKLKRRVSWLSSSPLFDFEFSTKKHLTGVQGVGCQAGNGCTQSNAAQESGTVTSDTTHSHPSTDTVTINSTEIGTAGSIFKGKNGEIGNSGLNSAANFGISLPNGRIDVTCTTKGTTKDTTIGPGKNSTKGATKSTTKDTSNVASNVTSNGTTSDTSNGATNGTSNDTRHNISKGTSNGTPNGTTTTDTTANNTVRSGSQLVVGNSTSKWGGTVGVSQSTVTAPLTAFANAKIDSTASDSDGAVARSASVCASQLGTPPDGAARKERTLSDSVTSTADDLFVCTPRKPDRTDTIVDVAKKRPVFKSKSAPAAVRKTSVAAPVAANRIKASSNLACKVWELQPVWLPQIQHELRELESAVNIEPFQVSYMPDGVTTIVTTVGKYQDMWDEEQDTFVKCLDSHLEHMKEVFVGLDAAHLEVLGKMDFAARERYFQSVQNYILEHHDSDVECDLIFIVPEVASHYKKQVSKYDRAMRRRVAEDDNATLSTQPPITPPPAENFYTNTQTELQVLHEIRAFYPRKFNEAAELLANCVIDMGYARYRALLDENTSNSGGSVRSKTTPAEVSVESLTKIQGLPPRIATKLITEARSIGKLKQYLGQNLAMRESRIKLFGQGMWNDSLMAFLHETDPSRTL